MFHPTFLAQKVRIQLVRIHIIVCEAKAGTVEVLCKNNTPLLPAGLKHRSQVRSGQAAGQVTGQVRA